MEFCILCDGSILLSFLVSTRHHLTFAKCARQNTPVSHILFPPNQIHHIFFSVAFDILLNGYMELSLRLWIQGKQSRFNLLSKTYNSHWRRASSNKGVKEWNSSCHASRWWTGRALRAFHSNGRPLSKVLQLIRRKYLEWFSFCIWDIHVQKQECIQCLIPSCQKETC